MKKATTSRAATTKPRHSAEAAYWHGGHTTHRLRYHLVWCPKYRRRVLTGDLALRLRALLQQSCEVHGWRVHELNIQPDHVHLLVQLTPERSLSTMTQMLKGRISRVLRAEFPALEEFLWGAHFWADGYFADTVGQIEEAALRRYIQQQREPNAQ